MMHEPDHIRRDDTNENEVLTCEMINDIYFPVRPVPRNIILKLHAAVRSHLE